MKLHREMTNVRSTIEKLHFTTLEYLSTISPPVSTCVS